MRRKNPEKAALLREDDIMDQGEPDVLYRMALIMTIFPQYTLQAIIDMPLLEAEMLMEQAEHIEQKRMYWDRLNALTAKISSIL